MSILRYVNFNKYIFLIYMTANGWLYSAPANKKVNLAPKN